jgi:CheY-like chemotaxis protein
MPSRGANHTILVVDDDEDVRTLLSRALGAEGFRVEAVGDGEVRVARWILRPRAEWELQDAPPMLPVARFAEALAAARRAGVA